MDDSMMIDSVFSKWSGGYTKSEAIDEDDTSGGYMDFDSYLKLMVAQMSNQDFNNPMDDSEVLAQMAQYSMLEGIKNMTQQSSISYATSLVGKIVTIYDGSTYCTGKVDSVNVSGGKAWLMIDGTPYDSSKVSDIVSDETYNLLSSLVGHRVKYKDEDDQEAYGTVKDFIFTSGEAGLMIGNKIVELSRVIELADDDNSQSGDDKTEESDSGEDDQTVTETQQAEVSDTMTSYMARSESLINDFMKELDAVSGVEAVSETSGVNPVSEEYIVETVMLEVPDYAAGAFADGEFITGTETLSGVDNTYGSGNGTLTRDLGGVKINSSRSYDLDPETAERTSDGKLKGVTTEKGVSSSGCVPHRISVEDYPEEAELADELGTRMYDIRFIHNHAITSRIKTGEVIGHTSGGKAITEIGYSGVGQLGEVVTFADGTQRVEVLLKNGNSTWLTTSGRLTLDEICIKNGKPGSLAGKLTPEESAIRHFSDPMSEMNSGFLDSMNAYLRRQGVL